MDNKLTVPDRPLTWLITGCSSGFGVALTRIAQKNGHNVVATSRNPSKHTESQREIENRRLRRAARPLTFWSTTPAGRSMAPAESFTEEEVRAQMETIFFGPYRLMRAMTTFMRERRTWIIVNISSGAGLEGRESMGIYAAAKAGMDGNKVLAKEIAPFGVRVLTVALGAFDTNVGSGVKFASRPTPREYDGSEMEKLTKLVAAAATVGFPADGDHLKAAQVIYEVVTGTGVGERKEAERVLPLGRDLAKRVSGVVEGWQRTMGIFGDVCNNVLIDK
ncbi:NAD(P)-binding protein [Colletotrichum caudatum]|nr:NAD(P)-binding protein [Colletotrichum caudatum]